MGMKTRVGMLVWLMVSMTVTAEDEVSLKAQLADFNLAFMQADAAALAPMLHDAYQHTNSGSKAFGKQAWLGWIASRRDKVTGSELIYHRYDTQDLKLVMGKEMAVVTGRNIATGVDGGKPFSVDIRFTHVWVWEEGRWQRLAFHDAPAK